MTDMPLSFADIMELGELLQFVAEWLHSDPTTLDTSLIHFVGNPAYNVHDLHADLARFAFLLHGNDGEHLLDP